MMSVISCVKKHTRACVMKATKWARKKKRTGMKFNFLFVNKIVLENVDLWAKTA